MKTLKDGTKRSIKSESSKLGGLFHPADLSLKSFGRKRQASREMTATGSDGSSQEPSMEQERPQKRRFMDAFGRHHRQQAPPRTQTPQAYGPLPYVTPSDLSFLPRPQNVNQGRGFNTKGDEWLDASPATDAIRLFKKMAQRALECVRIVGRRVWPRRTRYRVQPLDDKV